MLLAGAFFPADLAVWHWSIIYTSVANATLLANFAPIFVTLGAWALFASGVAGAKDGMPQGRPEQISEPGLIASTAGVPAICRGARYRIRPQTLARTSF